MAVCDVSQAMHVASVDFLDDSPYDASGLKVLQRVQVQIHTGVHRVTQLAQLQLREPLVGTEYAAMQRGREAVEMSK